MRVHEIAKKLKVTSKEVIVLLKKEGVKAASPMTNIEEETAKKILSAHKPAPAKAAAKSKPAAKSKTAARKRAASLQPAAAQPVAPAPKPAAPIQPVAAQPAAPAPKPAAPVQPVAVQPAAPKPAAPAPKPAPAKPALKPLELRMPLTVKELAEKLFISPGDVIKKLMGLRIMATINQLITEETIEKVLPAYGYELKKAPSLEQRLEAFHQEEDDPASLKPRPVVVTLMGHVDHGKTSLLDKIRETRVAAGETGGITQHLGAYQVKLPKGAITFLDTPGHEAFTAMRARGAHVTDVVILVVAADDGVMPQTQEAVDHARAAEATIVVALNKIDMPGANVEKVKQQLAGMDLASEDWGGKTIVVPVSAKTGQGVDQLLEMMLLEAELMELKANPDRPARGYILEAELSKGKGPTAHVLVQNGTLRVGDIVVSGLHCGKVRALLDEHGKGLKAVGPSSPAELLGLSGVPVSGESFFVVPDERQARELTGGRTETRKLQDLKPARRAMTLEDFQTHLQAGEIRSLNLILKADVHGSAEALKDTLAKLSTDKAELRFLHVGVGDITGPDILLAEASDAVVIGFHVGATPEAEELAKREQVDIRRYGIIYQAVSDIRAALEGLLEPKRVEQVVGRAKVLRAFKVSKVGTVAGCQVVKGKVLRGLVGRVLRGGASVHEGKISSLKRFKDDVREVAEGMECGISVGGFSEFQPGDLIEAVEVQEVAQKL